MMITPPVKTLDETDLLGKEVRVLKDDFSPEVIGRIEKIRGHGTLQAVEVRVHPNQPGARVRVAFVGMWELTRGGDDA